VALDTSELKKALKKKGFRKTARKDEDEYEFPETTVRTHCSNGPKEDIGPVLEKLIATQMHISKEELRDFIRCPMKQDAYEAILREKKYLS